MQPTMLYVVVSKAAVCLCSPNQTMTREADIRVETKGLAHGQVLADWSGVEFRCPDGASLIVDEVRRQARLAGIPFTYNDQTGGVFAPAELDQDWEEEELS